jgi:ornithine--oxo-acid transaminase
LSRGSNGTGDGYDALEAWSRAVNPQFVRVLRTIGFDKRWASAHGSYLSDADGVEYLDLLGGFGMFAVGRNNPRVKAALIEHLEAETANAVQLGVSPVAARLAEALVERLPASIDRVLFTSSGTEAVEAAIKLGRAATGRPRVVSAEHGFHGLTLGSLSASGCAEFRDRFEPLLPGFARVPFNDLEALERELAHEDVALFLVEPVQGKGVHLAEPGYLEGAQELCRRYGTLFCLDEVQTGFGRTGKMFALEHWGLEPDLVPMAKSLSGGYVPVGALGLRAGVHAAVFDSMENAVVHGSTFAPNDLAMAAGLATLEELDREGLVERSARLGERLLELTRELGARHASVREARGLGLMWALELGEPERGRRTYRMLERRQPGIFAQLVVVPLFTRHRILTQVAGHGMNVVKVLPPLNLPEPELERFVAALDDVLARAERVPRAAARFALDVATHALR